MKRKRENGVSVWGKFSDFVMDVAKYVLTAILIMSAFKELVDIGKWIYVLGMFCVIMLLLLSVVLLNKDITRD